MSSASESLRYTLDHLRLDPDASADRHYLVTVLRRLGYTEEQIVEVLGPEPGSEIEAEPDGERVIEVEYLASSTAQEFEPVYREHPRDDTLVFEEVGPEPEPEAAYEEMDFVEVEPATPVAFEEPTRLRLQVVQADSPQQAEEAMRARGVQTLRAVPVYVDANRTQGEVDAHAHQPHHEAAAQQPATEPTDWPEAQWEDAPAEESAPAPWPAADDTGWAPATIQAEPAPAVEDAADWEAVPESEASEWEAVDDGPGEWEAVPEPEATWAADAGASASDADWEAVPEAASEPAAWPDAAPAGAFEHNGYTLYARDVDLSTGKQQRIYFFAKGEPRSGEAVGMPEGYEVKENEKTGLPFLARQREGQA